MFAPAAPASAVTTATHTLSLSAARQVYDRYLAASDAAAAQGNETQGLAIVGGTLWPQLKGQYTALTTTGIPVPRYRYGQPVFYVPGLAGYPEWFMVAVPRQTDTDGHLGPAVNTLLLFDRSEQAVPWTLNGIAVLDQPLPAIARDQAGYAIAVINDDASLLLRPDVVGATQAAVVDEGPDSAAAAVIASGPQTTGLYAAQAAVGRADAAVGAHYQWLAGDAGVPQFELRTTDGGALTMYGMDLDTTAEHPGLAAGSPIPVPAGLSPLFTKRGESATTRCTPTGPTSSRRSTRLRPRITPRSTSSGAPVTPPTATRTSEAEVLVTGYNPEVGSWRRPGCGWRAGPPTRW